MVILSVNTGEMRLTSWMSDIILL